MSNSFAGLITQLGAGCMTGAELVRSTSQYMQILAYTTMPIQHVTGATSWRWNLWREKALLCSSLAAITNEPGKLVTQSSILVILTGPINKESPEAFGMPVEALVIAQGKG